MKRHIGYDKNKREQNLPKKSVLFIEFEFDFLDGIRLIRINIGQHLIHVIEEKIQ